MIQLEKRFTVWDEIWYGRYAIEVYTKTALFSFLQLVILTWRTNEFMTWNRQPFNYSIV
jgi:hypothetical protein